MRLPLLIDFRPFRNSDPPTLVKLWNQAVPGDSSARPLLVHELDDHAFGSVLFDRAGLIVAERDGRPVGFTHAGFGPSDSEPDRAFALGKDLGVVAMVVAEPGADEHTIALGLVTEAERYLRCQGAKVIYGGGQFPLNPFYWGIYSGSEASGVPSSHTQFSSALSELGYEPVSTAVHLRFDLGQPAPRIPRAAILRRQVAAEFLEDALPTSWWENVALNDFHLSRVRLVSRTDSAELAQARTWDMTWFGRFAGRSRIGIFNVEVAPEHRRKGYARFLISEILREAHEHDFEAAEVQTLVVNEPALALYQSLGFEPVEQSTVFRLPGPFPERSRPD